LLVVAALALVASGCKVDATVSVDVHDDGSGVVTLRARLDADAVQAAQAGGAKLEDRVRLSDLTSAGWSVSPWRRAADGSATLVISKRFQRPEQVAGIIRELSGTDGPLRDVTATRDRGLLTTDYRVTGGLDLAAAQTGIRDDQDLVRRLTAQSVDVAGLDQSLLAEVRQSLALRLAVTLPGGGHDVVTALPSKRVAVDESTSPLDLRRVALFVAALVLVTVAVLVLLGGRRRARRRR
jgi:hypothetical protein